MKLSYSWLKELVPDLPASPEEVAHMLTMHAYKTNIASRLGSDTLLETEITPNRAHDSLSYVGVAREVAALYNLPVHEPPGAALPKPIPDVAGYRIEIEDSADTPRYLNVLVKGVQNAPSPSWMQTRLLASGLRPINAIVDSTNYVLLEYGQPSHAFAVKKLPGKTTGVRRARLGETLALLAGQEMYLPAGTLVITSDDIPIAAAGIMGGASSQVEEDTSDILLEVADFRPFAIYQTAAALKLHTEAAQRFAKGISPTLIDAAAARLVYLVQEIAGGTIRGVLDYYPSPPPEIVVPFSPERVGRIVGMTVTAAQSQQALERLRFQVDTRSTPWHVTVPKDRLDVIGEHDLVEEVVRVGGLATIPTAPLASPVSYSPQPAAPVWREIIRDLLVARGFAETYNVSFEPLKLGMLFDPKSPRITVSNPLAPEQAHLRISLLPGLTANFMTNKDDFHKPFTGQARALFEIGSVFRPGKNSSARVPGIQEEEHIAGLLVGGGAQVHAIVDDIFKRLGSIPSPETLPFVGTVPEEIVAHMKYRLPVAAFVINATQLYQNLPPPEYSFLSLEELKRQALPQKIYQPLSRYPSVFRDISFLVEDGTTVEQAQEVIERVGGDLVIDSELFDEFLPADVAGLSTVSPLKKEENNLKGLAFHLEYQALDHTLSTDEVAAVHNQIVVALEQELGAQMR